ncbi:hypothetical protein QQ045_000109 [Rhodiola kirilowii]
MDIISSLPEPVIYHILSFLSPTEALSTSTLSKTWLQIINSFSTNLEFDDKLSPGTDFASSVCQTLNRHTADIRRVTLILSYPYEVEHTSPWIQAMEARNVQKVKVSGTHDNSFQQVHSYIILDLSTFKTIPVLDVSGPIFVILPYSSYLPNLKILRLEIWRINYGVEDTIPRLLSSCPALKELKLDYLTAVSMYSHKISVSSSVLQSFRLRFRDLRSKADVFKLHLDVPCIESLDIELIWSIPYVTVIKPMPALREVKIAVVDAGAGSFLNLMSFLDAVSYIESLSLCAYITKVLTSSSSTWRPFLPSLTKLEVGADLTTISPWLDCVPKLEKLVCIKEMEMQTHHYTPTTPPDSTATATSAT